MLAIHPESNIGRDHAESVECTTHSHTPFPLATFFLNSFTLSLIIHIYLVLFLCFLSWPYRGILSNDLSLTFLSKSLFSPLVFSVFYIPLCDPNYHSDISTFIPRSPHLYPSLAFVGRCLTLPICASLSLSLGQASWQPCCPLPQRSALVQGDSPS